MYVHIYFKIASLQDISSKDSMIEQKHRKSKQVWQPRAFFNESIAFVFDCKGFSFYVK